MQSFLSGLGQVVFYAVLSVFIFLPVAVVRARHGPPVKSKSGWDTLPPVLGFGGLLVALWFGYTGIGLISDWAYYLGISLLLLGLAISSWGLQALGRYYSNYVVIYQGHQLVERGPYKFVRHPIYTGVFLVSVGVGLAVQSWAAVVLMAIVTSVAYGYRIPVEEKALISEFGEQYVSYSRRVKRLIPFIF